jgi:NADPH:quinone reductase-like Zn-dependent oxidoreductase
MQAATIRRYGPPSVVAIEDLPDPVPGPGEILIRTRAASVSSADWRIRTLSLPRGMGLMGRPAFGFRGPRRPVFGTECAGTIAATGPGVTAFRPGDAVIAYLGARMGAHAQYTIARADGAVIPKPASLTWEEAAAFSFGGATALIYLRDGGKIRAGQSLLLIGASGSVGHAALQIATARGAQVTTVTSAANTALIAAHGAVRTLDYRATDIAQLPDRFDLIMDCVGAETWPRMRPLLAPDGRFLMVAADLPQMLQAAFARGPMRPVSLLAGEKRADLDALAGLHAQGRYRPLIDSTFPLSQAAAAHARVESHRKTGNVVLVMD